MTLPLRIGVLAGASAPGIESLLERPDLFQLAVVAACAAPLKQATALEAAQVPVVYEDEDWAELFVRFRVDYVVLYGNAENLTDSVLHTFADRVISIHDGDLMPYAGETRRRYAGPNAVREAILAGEPATRSSIYFAVDHSGDGPVALVSEAYPVAPLAADAITRGEWEPLTRYAEMHREWMLRAGWGPLLRRFLELLAAGAVQRVGAVVWIDGVPAPCRLGESPDACRHEGVRMDVPASCPFIAIR
jgi:folate-dependent phosphoribosylglycinamide formyltransferase PurN